MKAIGTTAEEKLAYLRENYGSVAILVTRELDPYSRWDGDGPDPIDLDYFTYDVSVKAVTVHAGKLVEGVTRIGCCYYQVDEPLGDVHGYLPKMIDEAVANLYGELLEAK